MVCFDNIHHDGELVSSQAAFDHYGSTVFHFKYDANFLQFRHKPSLPQWQIAENYLLDYQRRHNQAHLKFYMPENETVNAEVLLYLYQSFYTIGAQELFEINPIDFKYGGGAGQIDITEVTVENLEDYLQLQSHFDRDYGEQYVHDNKLLHKQHFQAKNTLQFLAYDDGKPAGSLQVFIGDCTVEIDNVGVLPNHRLKGIAAKLQLAVMKRFEKSTIILVADSSDTPKEMYQKQGYKKVGFRYEIMKLLSLHDKDDC